MPQDNPLLSSYDLPPFSAIRLEHLVPAVERIIADSQRAVADIIASQTPLPTWDDLVLAMDAIKARLDSTVEVIDLVGSAHAQPAWAEAVTRCIDLATAFKARLGQNDALFQLYRRLAESRMATLFDPPRRRVLDKILEQFRLSGIHLPADRRQRLAELNVDINRLEREFLSRVRQCAAAWSKHIEDESRLAGLPDTLKRSMADDAGEHNLRGWLIRLDDEQFRRVMLHAEDRSLRQEMWQAYHARATGREPFTTQPGNDDVFRALLDARHEKARLLGYEHFAHLATERQMAKSTDQVLAYLQDSLDDYHDLFASDVKELEALALQHGIAAPQPWDYEYLAEKIRRHEGASRQDLREYFPLDRVLERLCEFVHQLFGLELLERSDFDRWRDDVRLFELKEHGQTLGYLYLDPYRHELSGAVGEMIPLRSRRLSAEGRPRLPIAVLHGKLVPGVGDTPCLLDHQQLGTLWHELGHCLQLLSTRAQHRDISGLDDLPPDALEFAGQVLGQWASSREFLVWVSGHYRTGEALPAEQAERLLQAAGTQTSWAAANFLLQASFDFEVHRREGDRPSAEAIFAALSARIGVLRWPADARPFNSWIITASRYAARVYSYGWSNDLARLAFGQFVENGVLDPETGRAFREAFFSQGDTRSLIDSLELFLGQSIADDPALADRAADPSALLIRQLHTAQQRMIRLNDAVPVPSAIARRQLDGWFADTFRALGGAFGVADLSVRPRQGPTAPLDALFWRAVAGRFNPRELFADTREIDIVHGRDAAATVPAGLNGPEAKAAIGRMLDSARVTYESQLKQALADFWDKPAEFSEGRAVIDWLADELGAQLMTQADLHLLDETLTPQLHKAVTDYALSAPDAASREDLLERIRPGVYTLRYTPPAWGGSLPVRDAVLLTQPGSRDDLATSLLWRPGRPLEVVDNLAALATGLAQSGDAQGQLDAVPLPENFLVRQAKALREAQEEALMEVLRHGPQESVDTWLQHLDSAVDIGQRLDLTWAMDAYQLRSTRNRLDDWLHGYRYVTGADRLAWWAATRDWQATAASLHSLPPDPVTLATPDAIRNWTRTELARLAREKNLIANPDRVFLGIRKQILDPRTPQGASPFESGVVLHPVKKTFLDRRSMAQWAMSNLTPDERNTLDPVVEGPLEFAHIVQIIEAANVGARLPVALRLHARERQAEWMLLKGKQIRAEAWAAHISGDLTHDRDNTGLSLVLAALDNPEPAGRRKVNGHETVVRQLQWGDSVLNDVLAFGVKMPASRPSLTLYTPNAPDGKAFREVHGGGGRDLKQAVAGALTRTPEMTHWLISRLTLAEQAAQLASLVPGAPDLTTSEKIKQVTQSVFSSAKSRAVRSFSSNASFPVVETDMLEALYETQVSHALQAVDALTVSNAERDSTAAQEGRRRGVSLLTGAMSVFPASRLGAMLGRAILPVMAGGIAVSAINDEKASFNQWLNDFIGGLGEVLAEGGEDLIMHRAGTLRRKTRPLSTLPPMPAPELKRWRMNGFDAKGLIAEERNLYRDAGGQGYLRQGTDYYKTAIQDGERIVYAPGNRADQQRVIWDDGQWQAKERHRLRGGGPLMSLLRTPETPQQQTYNALVEGVLANYPSPTPDMFRKRRDAIYSMPPELAERILRESMDEAGIAGIEAYRSRMRDLKQARLPFEPHQSAHKNLVHKYLVWEATDFCTRDIESHVPDTPLSTAQKIRVFDTIVPLRKELYDNAGNFTVDTAVLPDHLTGAKYIVIAPGTRKANALHKIQTRLTETITLAMKTAEAELRAKFHGDISAAKQYSETPEGRDEYTWIVRDKIREEMKASSTPGLLTEIRNNKLPYLVYNKGKAQQKYTLLAGEEVNRFGSSLGAYEAPEIEIVSKVPSKKVSSPPSSSTETSAEVKVPAATDKFTVDISPLAETQMSYDNFPETARTKINEIMDDIRAGRTTTKRINRFYWYDMAQLDPGSGRGAWRAAFERKGDTWSLQGFYNYHANRQATVWGD